MSNPSLEIYYIHFYQYSNFYQQNSELTSLDILFVTIFHQLDIQLHLTRLNLESNLPRLIAGFRL